MDARIKSPAVARRLRGFGGIAYIVDAGTPMELIMDNARHFKSNGLDFDALCRDGRLSVFFDGVTNRRARALVSREIRRQERITHAPVTDDMVVDRKFVVPTDFVPFDG